MGAGSIGSLFGGFLAKNGNDVTLIGREDHINAIRNNGLKINGVSGSHNIKIKAMASPSQLEGNFDLVLLTVKAYDTEEAINDAKSLIDDDSVLLCLQNGLGVEEIASKIIGRKNILRGLTSNGSLKTEPGIILHTGKGPTIIGELDGKKSERSHRIAKIFSEAGLSTNQSEKIFVDVWTKLLVNAGINPFGALTGLRNGELLFLPNLRSLMTEVVLEGINVSKMVGIRLEKDPAFLMLQVAERTALNKNSMLQDIENGKRTEICYINGAIAKIGREKNLSTPLNKMLTHLIEGLEKNRIKVKNT